MARLKPLHYVIQIGVAGAKAPCEPVSAALGNGLAIGDDLKLASLTWLCRRVDAEAFLDEGREPRDLLLITVSCRAVNDFDLHIRFMLHRVP